jgi:hypothetical protein
MLFVATCLLFVFTGVEFYLHIDETFSAGVQRLWLARSRNRFLMRLAWMHHEMLWVALVLIGFSVAIFRLYLWPVVVQGF